MANQRKRSQQARRQATQAPKQKQSRLSIAFIVVSSLVICSLLAAGLVTAASLDLFGSDDDNGADTSDDFADPNEDVIAAQQTAVANNPNDYEALVLLANLLGNSGRLDDAVSVYERALQQRPDDAATRLDFARALADGGKSADAEVQFKKVIDLEPNNQFAFYYLAELYRTAQPPRTAEAIPLYQRTVEIDSQSFIGTQARDQLVSLGAASPAASPEATP